MRSTRQHIEMTAEEVRAFLESERKLQVATLQADGMPHLTTLFYGLHDNRIAFWTYGRSQKAVNLRRDPRIGVLVEQGVDYAELRGVSLQGSAELVEDTDRVRDIGLALAARDGRLDDDARRVVVAQAPKRVVVVVHPDRVISWDHRKL